MNILTILIALVVHWYLALLCQTVFLHRYASHQSFRMSMRAERTFYLLTLLVQGPSFLNARAYAGLHRRHHRYSDRAGDPHSPHNHRNILAMMVSTYHSYIDYLKGARVSEVSQTTVPRWPMLERVGDSWLYRLGWAALFSLFYLTIAPFYVAVVLVPIHCLLGPIQGAIVNWCGHRYGYRNYRLDDQSKNTFMVDVLLMGELYQNNHHQDPERLNFAHRWFEFDLGFQVITLLDFLGVIQVSNLGQLNRNSPV